MHTIVYIRVLGRPQPNIPDHRTATLVCASGHVGLGTKVGVLLVCKRNQLKYGMVTMCVGMGQGAAGIFEAG